MADQTLRDKLAFAMYLVDYEAENLPGPDRDLCLLAQRWGRFRSEDGVSSLADGYYRLADRMIEHWNMHNPIQKLRRKLCAALDRVMAAPPRDGDAQT